MTNEEIDRLVAEKAMNWEAEDDYTGERGEMRPCRAYYEQGHFVAGPSWSPSTSIADAMEVLEKHIGLEPEIHWNDEFHTWYCGFMKHPKSACAVILPMAICKAVLAVEGIEVDDD